MQEMPEATAGRVAHAGGDIDRVGTTLCGWTIERSLGGGPVSTSWFASRRGESAVVRVLRDPFAQDDPARTEWLRASWAANRFNHGRVVKVIEQGVDERGVPVIVRGWAKGESLDETAKRSVLDPMFALRLVEQLLDALEMAHAHGIVHSAISPSNVVVTPRRTVRLLDFATTPGLLGRRVGELDALAAARVGPFTAPERRASPPAPPSEQSDVWSLGACLYFSIVGLPPPVVDPGAKPPSLRDAAPHASEDLAAVVDLALSQDPLERYESAYAMLGDVRRLFGGRKPKLDGALAPVPSQTMSAWTGAGGPPSMSRLSMLPSDPPPASLPPVPGHDLRGNILLIVAIGILVGLATFVLVRERLSEAPPVLTDPTAQ